MMDKLKIWTLTLATMGPVTHSTSQTDPPLPGNSNDIEWIKDLRIDDPKKIPQDPDLHSSVDLRTAGMEELTRNGLWDRIQAIRFLEYRKKYGIPRSLFELKYIEGFDAQLIQRSLPLIEISQPPRKETSRTLLEGEWEYILRWGRILETQEGYLPDKDGTTPYLGSPDKGLLSLRYQKKDLVSIGIITSKDAGERISSPGPKRSTPLAFHAMFQDLGPIDKVIIGDLDLYSGMGSVCNTGFAFGGLRSGASGTNARIKPHTSSSEAGYFRGVATSLNIKGIKWITGVSRKRVDADTVQPVNAPPRIKTLYSSGYRRTKRELGMAGRIIEKTAFTVIEGNWQGFQYGATGLWGKYQFPFLTEKNIRKVHTPKSQHYGGIGPFFSISTTKWSLSGEIGLDKDLDHGHLIEGSFFPHPDLQFSVKQYSYSSGYFIPYTNGPGSSGNERGTAIFLHGDLFPRLSVTSFFHSFQKPWPSHFNDSPSQGSNIGSEFQLIPSRKRKITLDIQQRRRMRDKVIDREPFAKDQIRTKYDVDLQVEYPISSGIIGRSTLATSRSFIGDNAKTGALFAQDLISKWEELPIALRVRTSFFDIPDHSTRIYLYEHDVLYAFSVPSYSGQGFRGYLVFRWDLLPEITLEMKLAEWFYYYQDEKTIGSGKNSIEGSTKTRVRIQLRGKL